ncbi:hypothetical protein EON64_00370 [archaeon]|nr:MAG: hypothetical protein EON64_00370 [archaeon]
MLIKVDPNRPKEEDVHAFSITTIVVVVRPGEYQVVPKQYFVEPGKRTNGASSDTEFANPWLTPFYLMLFDYASCNTSAAACSYPPNGLNESIKESVWFQRCVAIDGVLIVTLPRQFNVTHVKIQREGYGSLSLAELEVFPVRLNPLQGYNLGSPLQSSNPLLPYQPLVPFYSVFTTNVYDGLWYLNVQMNRTSSGQGKIGDIAILITDYAGIVHVHYQDITAYVSSLPRHGSLFTTYAGSPRMFAQYPEVMNLQWKELIPQDIARVRPLGICSAGRRQDRITADLLSVDQSRMANANTVNVASSGDLDHACADSFGAPMQLIPQNSGDVPIQKLQRSQRAVYYLPSPGFVGDDSFEYVVTNPHDRQEYKRTVSITVQTCQQFANAETDEYLQGVSHPLCLCVPSADRLVGNKSACLGGLNSLCGNASYANNFFSLCSACNMLSTLTVSASSAVEDTCNLWLLRAVAALQQRQLCNVQYSSLFKNTIENIDYVLYKTKFAGDALVQSSLGYNVTSPICLKRKGVSPFTGNNREGINNKIPLQAPKVRRYVPYQTLLTNKAAR